jgi:hypothetical protein
MKFIGPNQIHNSVIKNCSEIINLSLSTGKFPFLRKLAVVSIFTKGNRALVHNYKHISLLKNFSKIFKSIVYDHLSYNFKS